MADRFVEIKNGECIDRNRVPRLAFAEFQETLKELCAADGRIVQYFAYREGETCRLFAVIRQKMLLALECDAPAAYPSLTAADPKFNVFEREIAEQFGIMPRNHPWFKSVRYHQNYLGKPDLFGQDYTVDIPGSYPHYAVKGDNIHEVGVGPVHAGVIEPGHFRFNCIGEKVLHLEIQLGYQHRGVEQLLLNTPPRRWPIIIEGIAGDTTMGNSICFCRAIESLAGLTPTPNDQRVRSLALELERLSNHVGDLGALSGDVAFLPPASYFGRIRGEFLNLLLLLSGNRFGKGLLRPGRVLSTNLEAKLGTIQAKCRQLQVEIEHICHLLFNAASVLSRFEDTGIVSRQCAGELGLVGVAARASGVAYDVRAEFPTDHYLDYPIAPVVEWAGDVCARAKVRRGEILQSFNLIRDMTLPVETGSYDKKPAAVQLRPSACVVSLVEGWRGELSHCLLTDGEGRLLRYKIKDPSFHNWNGLAQALRNEGIFDFPLCNKSFNLSYCGFDL